MEQTHTFATPEGLLTVVSRERRGRDARRADRHLDFIVDHEGELVAAGAEGFAKHGAGAVVLWREASRPRWWPGAARRPFRATRLWYATQLHVLPGVDADAVFSGWEAELIETYDPQAETVVVVVDGGELAGYRLRTPVSPAAALQRSRAGLN